MSRSRLSVLSIIIPTYGRERVLVDSVRCLLEQRALLVLVDQTQDHEPTTLEQLERWERAGEVRWVRLQVPSIPHAMNTGLLEADTELVLFLDDDIIPDENLVAAHVKAHQEHPEAWAVVGQVLQPGEESHSRDGWKSIPGLLADLDFPYWSDEPAWVQNVMAGNLSVKRELAIKVGGFDENYSGAAYRFETEFARRLIQQGGKIRFEPGASIRHLQAQRGGTRSQGSHLKSISARHGQGDYYFAFRSGFGLSSVLYALKRPFREVCTKFHLKHPWYIPIKFIGEIRAFWTGLRLAISEPKLIQQHSKEST